MISLRLLAAGLLRRVRPQPLAAWIKSCLPFGREDVATREGLFHLDCFNLLGYSVIRNGIFEPATVAMIRAMLPEGGVFVDLGANEGYFTVIGSRTVGPRGRVLAVEPQARLQAVIAANLELNHCGNVEVSSVAVSDTPGTRRLFLTSEMATGGSGFQRATRYQLPSNEVLAMTFGEILERYRLERCDLVKMDIEGAEWEAIFGSPQLFREQRIKALALSLHPTQLAATGHSATEILDFLKECGYTPHPEFGSGLLVALPLPQKVAPPRPPGAPMPAEPTGSN
jgi:FkbM family methyltransferase